MPPDFLVSLAQPRPDPGGGAAAAYGARVGLALVEKVVRLERRRKHPGPLPADGWDQAMAQVQRLAARLTELQEADVEAYFHLIQTLAAGEAGPLRQAVAEALQCPFDIMAAALAGLELAGWTGQGCRPHLLADLQVAAAGLLGAMAGAYHIALANLPLMADPFSRQEWVARLAAAEQQGWQVYQRVRQELRRREAGYVSGS